MDGKKQNMDYVENSTRRSQPWRSNAVDRSIVFGLHGMRCKGWSSSSSVQNQAGQEIDDDKGGWRKSPNERKTFVGKDHCLELMIRRVMPKNALKDTVNEQKKECIFSPTRGNTMHIRSPDSTERLWNIWRALCSTCSDCSEMHVFGKNWRTWFSMVSKYSGTISNKIVDRTPNHNTHLCTVCSQARNASHALGSSHTDCSVIFVRLKRICHLVRTCLTLCCSLTCRVPWTHDLPHSLSSFYHDTRTRSTIGTTWSSPRKPSTSWTSPGSPSRQAAPSRITLAWKPAEWRKPAQDYSRRLWAQGACDCLEDRRLSWRSIAIMWCTERMWRT